MHRSGLAIGGRGIVLLAMLLLAIAVGVGAKGIDALTESSDATTHPTSTSNINAPLVPTPTNAAGVAQQPAPTVAPQNPTPDPTNSAQQPPATKDDPVAATTGRGDAATEVASGADKNPSKGSADVTASAAYAYDTSNSSVLYQLNPTEQMPVGSIVKVMTALVTVQYASLDDEVLIDASDLVDPGVYSNMALIEGDTLTVDQLLQGLLIPSGGDAAQALARYVGGMIGETDDPDAARDAFVGEMNAYAQTLGLQNTHFANATGDDAQDNYSSAQDVSLLGAALMQNADLAAIVAMPSYDFTSVGGNQYTMPTTNSLLGAGGIVGIKTGSTGVAGGCVVLAQETSAGDLIILTVLGSDLTYDDLNRIVTDSRWDDARQVLQDIGSGIS